MYCQVCSAKNPDEQEYCSRCHHKLLVISGLGGDDDEVGFDSNPEEQLSFDEHLLERVSILEEVVRRTADSVRGLLGTLHKLEQKFLVNQTGITAMRDLLEAKRVIGREEWSELWESRLDGQLLAHEKRERLRSSRSRIAALYRGTARDTFLRCLDAAETSLLAFDIEGAMQALGEAHELDPRNHELAFLLGETWFNEGEEARALGCFEKVLAEHPDHYESLVYSGVLHHELGDAVRAEALLGAAVSSFPGAFLPTFSLGAVFAGQGRLREAVAHLQRAVAIEPVPQALYLLGSCCHRMGRMATAIRYLEEAVRRDPALEDAHDLLGLALLDRRWHRKALDALRRAQRLRPKRLRYDELRQLLGGDPAPPASSAELPAAPPASAPPAASAGEPAASPQVSGDAGRWLERAQEALATGGRRQALSCFRRALVHDPENPLLLVAYAMVCLELDRGQEIQSVIDKVIGLDPGERLKATAYATLIEALRAEGKLREGNRIGRLLLAEGTSDFARTLACYEMAFNLAELEEDLDEALGLARSALESAPDELRKLPLAALGWVHYKRREFAQAVDCLTRSSELAPSPRTLTHLGMALLASGARAEAREALARARRLDVRVSPPEDRVIECLKDSARLLQDLRGKPHK